MKIIPDLEALFENNQFHHATYRDHGSLWEGLWVYKKYDGLRGFEPALFFAKSSPELNDALERVRGTGISVGSYGKG